MDNAELERRCSAVLERLSLDAAQYTECVERYGWDSPPVLGCLLALVREAWDEPELYVRSSRDDESWIVCAADHEGRERLMVLRSDPYRASEAEALVVALEAAPESARRPGDGAR